MKIKIPEQVTQLFVKDPMLVTILMGTVGVISVTAFFCIVFPFSKELILFMVIFFPLCLPFGFAFGRLKRHAILLKMKQQEQEEEEQEEEEKQKKLPFTKRKKKGKTLSQFEMSKKLNKWARKSEFQKSAEAHRLSEKEEEEDDDSN